MPPARPAPRHFPFTLLLFSIWLLFSLVGRASPAQPNPEPASGVLVASDTRWHGGDGAFTVPLGGDCRLWLFGDTWLSTGGGHLALVANTIGIQKGPCEGPLEVLWGKSQGRPRAFFSLSSGTGWLWPAGGTMVGGELYLFLHHLDRGPSGGPWAFHTLETLLLRIPNPYERPGHWVLNRAVIPWSGEELLPGASPQILGTHLWAFATRPAGTSRELIVARIPLEDLPALRMDRWTFLVKGGTPLQWGVQPGQAWGLFRGIGTEFTVSRGPTGKGWICLYSPGGISPEIHLRRAPRLEGPWGEPAVLYRCPEEERDQRVFCYGAKLHPECSRDGHDGLWITYTVNAREGSLADTGLARPRWIRLPSPILDRALGISN